MYSTVRYHYASEIAAIQALTSNGMMRRLFNMIYSKKMNDWHGRREEDNLRLLKYYHMVKLNPLEHQRPN